MKSDGVRDVDGEGGDGVREEEGECKQTKESFGSHYCLQE